MRRFISICHIRSWACTKPSANRASSSLSAAMWGMPCSSRVTSTGAARPGRARSPSISGSEPRSQKKAPAATTAMDARRTSAPQPSHFSLVVILPRPCRSPACQFFPFPGVPQAGAHRARSFACPPRYASGRVRVRPRTLTRMTLPRAERTVPRKRDLPRFSWQLHKDRCPGEFARGHGPKFSLRTRMPPAGRARSRLCDARRCTLRRSVRNGSTRRRIEVAEPDDASIRSPTSSLPGARR